MERRLQGNTLSIFSPKARVSDYINHDCNLDELSNLSLGPNSELPAISLICVPQAFPLSQELDATFDEATHEQPFTGQLQCTRNKRIVKAATAKVPRAEVVSRLLEDQFRVYNPVIALTREQSKENGTICSTYNVLLNTGKELVLRKVDASAALSKRDTLKQFKEEYIAQTLGRHTGQASEVLLHLQTADRSEVVVDSNGAPLTRCGSSLRPGDAPTIAYRLCEILVRTTKLGIAHLNLKLANLYWDQALSRVSLQGFRSPLSVQKWLQRIRNSSMEANDARKYCAPELWLDETEHDIRLPLLPEKLDVFSFGLFFVKLLLLEHRSPFVIDWFWTPQAHPRRLRNIKPV